jgi:hypothetical protein
MNQEPNQSRVWRGVAVFVGALLMTWPALINRFPLLYPDSMTYLADGRPVARAVFLHSFSDYYGFRSLIYSLGIYPFNWNISAWPVVALQAFLAAFVLWLVMRSLLPRKTVLWYLALCALLSLLTSLSWFVSLIMPDILGPVLYLCIFLLVFARENLSRPERVAVWVIAWWAVASHATHLMLTAALCVLFVFLVIIWRRSIQIRWRAVGEVALIALLAAGAQYALNYYLYGEASLNGERPPFLTARILADGPGRWYLQQHCGEAKFVLCDDVKNLPDNTDDFLWSENGIWDSASDEKQVQLRDEEVPFVLATLRAYPRAEMRMAAGNFWEQLTTFGLDDLGANEWVLKQFDTTLPSGRSHYVEGRQSRDALPLDFFMAIQMWTLFAALAVILAFTIYLWRRRSSRLAGLALVIVFTVIVNAFVTGVLSTVEDRYQSRVVWTLPFLAAVLVLHWRDQREAARAA